MDLLDRALQHGIITRQQYDAILALEARNPVATEAPRGFNWISVTYFAGALIVIFALGWFLADQWERLGAGGVLAVSLAYAALFIALARWLLRRDYRTAGGLAAALAVSTTPLIVWSLENLGGLWVPWRPILPFAHHREPWESGRWTIIQLATIGSALFALRRVRFPFIMAFIAVPAITMALPLSELLFGRTLGYAMGPWMVLLFGAALFLAGYAVDRNDEEREGFAFWLYLGATAAMAYGIVHLLEDVRWTRHLAPLLAAALFATSLYLRQRVFMVAGGITLFGYLVYLAADVFENTALFPIALAAIGLLILLSAVWVQRAYPRLVERLGGDRSVRPTLPGGMITAAVPLVIATLIMLERLPNEIRDANEQERLRRAYERSRTVEERRGPPPKSQVPMPP